MKYHYYEPYTHIMETEEGIIEFIKSKPITREGYTLVRSLLQRFRVTNFYSNITPVYVHTENEFGTPEEKEIIETTDFEYRIVTPAKSYDLYEKYLNFGEKIVDIKLVEEGAVELCIAIPRKTPKTVKYRFNPETGLYEKKLENSTLCPSLRVMK